MASVLIILGYPTPPDQPPPLGAVQREDLQGMEVILGCATCPIQRFAAIPDPCDSSRMIEIDVTGDPEQPGAAMLPKGAFVLRFTSLSCARTWYEAKKVKFGKHVAYGFDGTENIVFSEAAA